MGNGASRSRDISQPDQSQSPGTQIVAKEQPGESEELFTNDDSQRIVLITGCSSGIGLASAALLARDELKRFKVYATMRNLAKKEALEEAARDVLGERLIINELDVCSVESLTGVVKDILEKEQRIDILVNNAGTGFFCVPECATIDQITNVYETNVFGLIRMTNAVVPHMKAKESGHIVHISSVYGIVGVPFGDYYCSSKFAVEGYAESSAPILQRFNIKTTIIEPGPVAATSFAANAKALREQVDISSTDDKTKSLLKEALTSYYQYIQSHSQPAGEIAELVKKALLLKNPHFRYQTNQRYRHKELASKLSDPTGDKIMELYSKSFAGD